MRPLQTVLGDLIMVAEGVICRPRSGPAIETQLRNLAAEVRHADARPAEGVRTTRAAMVMVTALEEHLASDREPTSPWLMIAGAMLPLLRGEAFVALRNAKEQGAAS